MSVKLTDAQLVMMSAAAQRDDRCLAVDADGQRSPDPFRSRRGNPLRTPIDVKLPLYASALRGPVRRTMSSMSQRRMPISHNS
jgi:hypothetical protein